MKNFKNVIALIMTLAMLVSLAGCAKDGADAYYASTGEAEYHSLGIYTESTEGGDHSLGSGDEGVAPGIEAAKPTDEAIWPSEESTISAESSHPTEENQPGDSGTGTDSNNSGSHSESTKPTEPRPTEPKPTTPQPTNPRPTNPPSTEPEPTAPGHTHSYTKKVTAATCTERGYTTYTCSCGYSYVGDEKPAIGHDCEFVVTKEATCTEDGLQVMTCKICGEGLWDMPVYALGYHTWKLVKPAIHYYREFAVCPHCHVYLCDLNGSNAGDPNEALFEHIMATDGKWWNHSWANDVEGVVVQDAELICEKCGEYWIVDDSIYAEGAIEIPCP